MFTSKAKASPAPPSASLSPATLSLTSYLLLVSVLVVAQLAAANLLAEAKPLNQYQVQFRSLPPKEIPAPLGSSITLECEAAASPPPSIHWLKDGKRIIQNDLDENQLDDLGSAQSIQVDDVTRIALSGSRSKLFIDCADFSDEATYTCVAENAYSRVSSHSKLNLIKPAAPAAASGANENDLISDEVAALSELAAATGALKGMEGPANKNAASTAAGTNALGAVPRCLASRLRTGAPASAPARIHMWTRNIVEITKNDVTLFCRSNIKRHSQQPQQQQQQQQQQQEQSQQQNLIKQQEAGDAPAASTQQSGNKVSVSWTLPDEKLVSEDQKDKYEILETGDLLIKDLNWSDMGSYVCTVSDERGSDSVSSFVYPASVKVNNKRATAATNRPSGNKLAKFG